MAHRKTKSKWRSPVFLRKWLEQFSSLLWVDLNAAEAHGDKLPWGYLFILFALAVWGNFEWHLPPSGYAITVMAVLAGIMALRTRMRGREKALWFFVLVLYMSVEIRAINNDRESQKRDVAKIVRQGTEMIAESLGSDGFPFFKPTLPITKDSMFPVKVFYSGDLPLREVNVDISLRPGKGESWSQYIITSPVVSDKNDAMQRFHPQHIDLGTILPGTAEEVPIKLHAGNHYFLRISTRRKVFGEDIEFVPDAGEPAGWRVTACLYDDSGEKFLRGDDNCRAKLH